MSEHRLEVWGPAIPCELPRLARGLGSWIGPGCSCRPAEYAPAGTPALIYAHTHVYAQTGQSGNLTPQFLCSLEQGRELKTPKCRVTPGKALPRLEPQFFFCAIRVSPVLAFANACRQPPPIIWAPEGVLLSQKGQGQLRHPEAHTLPPLEASLWPLSRSRASVSSQ